MRSGKYGRSSKPPLIAVENLVKRYERENLAGAREDVLALDGVSLKIFPGTTLAVVGESGSGKSTLASCIACLELLQQEASAASKSISSRWGSVLSG